MTEERPFDVGEVSRLAEAVYQRVMVELGPHLPTGVTQEAHSNLARAWKERNEACNRLLKENKNLQAQIDELQGMVDRRNKLLSNLDRECRNLRYELDPLKRRLDAVRRAVDPGTEAPR